MAALEAATQWRALRAQEIFATADAVALGGRVKPGHDEFGKTPRLCGSACQFSS
jgi:hypothetical protein